MNTEKFREEMRREGVDYAGPIVADGKLHRFKVEGDRDRNCWYVSYGFAGAFGCWKRDIKGTWAEKRPEKLSETGRNSIRIKLEQAEALRRREEEQRHKQAKKLAAWIVSHAQPATSDHPYMTRKHIVALEGLLIWRESLVVPLCDIAGEIHSLQFIAADGTKRFLRGGQIAGRMAVIGIGSTNGPLVLCEGYATGVSIHEATGYAVVCAMNCGNLLAVAQALRVKCPEREIVIAADNDQFTANNPGMTKGIEAARAIGAKFAIPQFKVISLHGTAKPTDFNDLHQQEGIEIVKQQIDAANHPTESDDEAFARLATLTPAAYDRCRDAEAKRMSIRVHTLDVEVEARRTKPETAAPTQGLQQWEHPVDGAVLLDSLAAEFRKFLVLPKHADTVLALWTLHTYSWSFGEYSPILAITSPVKACGKSRILDVLEKITNNPFRTGNMSEAVLFRVLHSRKPSVLIDEFDTIPEDRRDALANILKHGFHRSGRVHRVEGDATKEVVEFAVFGPKALACIKLSTLDGATVSRCINIRMQRKKTGVKVARLRRYNGEEWQSKCLRWTADHAGKIEEATTEMPDALGDREQDIYEPLFVLANLAGGGWPEKIRCAALALCGESALDGPQETPVLLLNWIRTHFDESSVDKVSSCVLVQWLNERPDAPFATWNAGKGINQNDIRRHMAGFEIKPNTVRLTSNSTAKGYDRKWFEDAFAAYPAENLSGNGNTVTTTENIDDSSCLPPVTEVECYRAESGEKPNKDGHCYRVTRESAETAPENTKAAELEEELVP